MAVGDLRPLADQGVNIAGINPFFAARLLSMINAAPPELQSQIRFGSGLRTNAEQQAIYEGALKKHGPDSVGQWAARPGFSNHEKGVAADLRYGSDAARQWVHANANRFGLNFPLGNEDWHIEPTELRGTGAASRNFPAGMAPISPPSGPNNPMVARGGPNAGVGAPFEAYILAQARRAGLDPATALAVAKQESGLNPRSLSKSGAGGIYQFMPGTWEAAVKRYGLPYSLGDRFDPYKNIDVGIRSMIDNAKSMNLDPSTRNSLAGIYAAHFFGLGGAKALVTADPNQPAAMALRGWSEIAAANPFLSPYDTAGQALSKITGLVAKQMPEGSPETASTAYNVDEPMHFTPGQPGYADVVPSPKAARMMSDEELGQALQSPPNQNPAFYPQLNERSLRQKWEAENALGGAWTDPERAGRNLETGVRQTAASVPEMAAGAYGLGALGSSLVEYPVRKAVEAFGGDPNSVPSPATALSGLSQKVHQDVNTEMGTTDPQNTAQAIDRFATPALVRLPAPAITGPLANAAEVATPLTLGGGAGRMGANAAVQGSVADFMQQATQPGYKSAADALPLIGDVIKRAASAVGNVLAPPATAQAPIPEQPGMVSAPSPEQQNRDISIMAGLAAASVGLMVAPWTVRLLKGQTPPVPKMREIDPTGTLAPLGLKTQETTGDLLRTNWLDPNAPLKSWMARAGLPSVVVDRLQNVLDLTTGTAARSLVKNFFTNGRISTSAGTLNVTLPLQRLQQTIARMEPQMQASVQHYIHLRGLEDDFLRGATQTQGMTAADVTREMRNIEAAYPIVSDLYRGYRENADAMRQFISSGQYATVSRTRMTNAFAATPNWVPRDLDPTQGLNLWQRAAMMRKNATVSAPPWQPIGQTSPTPQPLRDPIAALHDHMNTLIVERMLNEVRGRYVDAMMGLSGLPDTIMRVLPADLRSNPGWRSRTVEIRRAGEPEFYAMSQLNADTLKFDPLFVVNGPMALPYLFKRGLEVTTTGALAPTYAIKQAIVDLLQARITTPPEFRRAGPVSVALAIPQAGFPRALKWLADGIYQNLDAQAGGFFPRFLGQQRARAFADVLTRAYDSSFAAQLEATQHNVAFMQSAYKTAQTALDGILGNNKYGVWVQRAAAGWKDLLETTQGAVRYATARKNQDMLANPIMAERLGATVRNLTGNPVQAGQSYLGSGKILGFDPVKPGMLSTVFGNRVMSGLAPEIARTWVPWFNPTIQGMKRFGQAYVDNPVRFTQRLWTYVGLPAAAAYAWNASLGPEYVQHMMDRRTDYEKTLWNWIGIPGVPPNQGGIPIPMFHEGSLFFRLMQAGLDHIFRPTILPDLPDGRVNPMSQLHTSGEDFKAAVLSFLGQALPPVPPIIAAPIAAYGGRVPSNMFAGDMGLATDKDPFSQFGGLSTSFENVARQLAGFAANVVGQSYAAMHDDPNWVTKPISGLQEAGFALGSNIPMVSGALGLKSTSMATQLSDEYFQKEHAIQELVQFYNKWTKTEGDVNVKPASRRGGIAAGSDFVAPETSLAPGQPPPTNPLYNAFIEDMVQQFGGDREGFRTLTGQYADWTEHIRRLNTVNYGNLPTFLSYVASNPEVAELAKKAGIDVNGRSAAVKLRNAANTYRNEIIVKLFTMVKRAEGDMSQAAGKPIRVEDLRPYN